MHIEQDMLPVENLDIIDSHKQTKHTNLFQNPFHAALNILVDKKVNAIQKKKININYNS